MDEWMGECVDRTTKRKVERKQPARKIEIAGGGEMGEKS